MGGPRAQARSSPSMANVAVPDPLASDHQRVRRDRQGQRSARQERKSREQADQPGPPLPAQLDQAEEGQDRGDQLARMPDAAPGGDPPDLGGEPEQRNEQEPVEEAADADPSEQPPAEPHHDRGEDCIDPDSHWSAVTAPKIATTGMSTNAGNGPNGT